MNDVAGYDDYFDTEHADGRIRLRIDGAEYRLKRPKIKEFRAIREALNELAARSTAELADDVEQAVEVDDDEDAGPTEPQAVAAAVADARAKSDALAAGEDALLEWWSAVVFPTLEENGRSFPDNPPVWLLSPQLVPAMMGAWLNRPAHPGA